MTLLVLLSTKPPLKDRDLPMLSDSMWSKKGREATRAGRESSHHQGLPSLISCPIPSEASHTRRSPPTRGSSSKQPPCPAGKPRVNPQKPLREAHMPGKTEVGPRATGQHQPPLQLTDFQQPIPQMRKGRPEYQWCQNPGSLSGHHQTSGALHGHSC